MFGNATLLQQTLAHDSYTGRKDTTQLRRRAAQRFWHLHFVAGWQRVMSRMNGREGSLRHLQGVEAPTARREAGIQTVALQQIVGSEGRSNDFDAQFRPLQSHNAERWIGIAVALSTGVVLPPVELIQIGSEYFVRDGHHRISVAASRGQATIEAKVTVWQ